MSINGIGGNRENPFLKKMQDDIAGLGYNANINKDDGNLTVSPNEDGAQKVGGADGVRKTNAEDMSAQANAQGGREQLIDKSQFTNENDIQEIDLEEFEDDM